MVREQPVGIPALVLLTAPEAQATVPVMEQIPDPGTQVVIQEAAQLVAQVLVMETVLMVVLVLVMVLEALEGHLMVLDQDQLVADPQMGMAQVTVPGTQVGKRAVVQLVAQVLVTETVLTVGIPALVLMAVTQATAVVMEQVQATVATALTVVLSLTLLL